MLAFILVGALGGGGKESVLQGHTGLRLTSERIIAIAEGNYLGKTIDEVRGSGYVVNSLEAALWCFSHTEKFEGAILAAANLGDDADTTAAICGQIAGAYYGAAAIPSKWLEILAEREMIVQMAGDLCRAGTP